MKRLNTLFINVLIVVQFIIQTLRPSLVNDETNCAQKRRIQQMSAAVTVNKRLVSVTSRTHETMTGPSCLLTDRGALWLPLRPPDPSPSTLKTI